MPRADSAPGGTLGSFGIAAENLRGLGYTVECDYPTINFVPSVSAVSIRDVGTDADLYINIDEEPASASDLDEYKLSRTSTPHTKMTAELSATMLATRRLPARRRARAGMPIAAGLPAHQAETFVLAGHHLTVLVREDPRPSAWAALRSRAAHLLLRSVSQAVGEQVDEPYRLGMRGGLVVE